MIDTGILLFVIMFVVVMGLTLAILPRLLDDMEPDEIKTQKENVFFTISSVILFSIGIYLSRPGYILPGGLFATVGVARIASDRFDEWARKRNLLSYLVSLFIVGAFFYYTWEGPAPGWFL